MAGRSAQAKQSKSLTLPIIYKHTQIGYVILGSIGGALLLVGVLLVAYGPNPVQWFFTLLLCGIAFIFSSLTVQLSEGLLTFYFGPGLIRKTVPLERVVHCAAVRTPWYYGWGIRLTPYGMLYNVSGTRAVEVTLDDGSVFRVGTDEPEALCRAMYSWLPTSRLQQAA